MKTSELTGVAFDWAVANALDWAVAKCEGVTEFGAPPGRSEAQEFALMHLDDPYLQYSTNWSQGGPIIERENIELGRTPSEWRAQRYDAPCVAHGPTPLIAAMRCYVVSKLGDEVDVPEELK